MPGGLLLGSSGSPRAGRGSSASCTGRRTDPAGASDGRPRAVGEPGKAVEGAEDLAPPGPFEGRAGRTASGYVQSNAYLPPARPTAVPDLGSGLLGCYRCGYVWRLRKSPVRICPRCKSPRWDVPRPPPPRRPPRKGGRGVEGVVGPRREALRRLFAEYGGRDLRIFGSTARASAGSRSDLDVLVRFDRPLGLLRRMELKERAERIVGRKVDVATERNLHWWIRPRVLVEAVPL